VIASTVDVILLMLVIFYPPSNRCSHIYDNKKKSFVTFILKKYAGQRILHHVELLMPETGLVI